MSRKALTIVDDGGGIAADVAIIAILVASLLFGILFQFLIRLGIIIAIVADVVISAVGAIVAIDAIVAIVPLFGQTCLQYHGNWKVSTENRRQTSFAQFCYLQLNPISFSFQAIAMALEDSFSSLIHTQPQPKPKISLLKFLGIEKIDCFFNRPIICVSFQSVAYFSVSSLSGDRVLLLFSSRTLIDHYF